MPGGGSGTSPSAGAAQEVHTIPRRLQHSRATRKTVPTRSFLIMVFTPEPHLVWRNGLPGISPTVADIGEHIGHLFIGQLHNRGHHAVVFGAIDHDGSRHAAQHDANTPGLIGHQEVRAREWWKDLRQALAIRLMTDRTGLHEHEFALLHLDFFSHGDDGWRLLDHLLDLFLERGDSLGCRIAFWRLFPK